MESMNDSSAMIRMCGYEWIYCNGRCSECVARLSVITTNRTKESIYNNSTRSEAT